MKACTANVHDKPQAYSQPYTKQPYTKTLVLNAWHRKTATYSVAYSTCAAHGAAGASCFDRQKISCIMTCERRLQRLVLTGQVHRWALPSGQKYFCARALGYERRVSESVMRAHAAAAVQCMAPCLRWRARLPSHAMTSRVSRDGILGWNADSMAALARLWQRRHGF